MPLNFSDLSASRLELYERMLRNARSQYHLAVSLKRTKDAAFHQREIDKLTSLIQHIKEGN